MQSSKARGERSNAVGDGGFFFRSNALGACTLYTHAHRVDNETRTVTRETLSLLNCVSFPLCEVVVPPRFVFSGSDVTGAMAAKLKTAVSCALRGSRVFIVRGGSAAERSALLGLGGKEEEPRSNGDGGDESRVCTVLTRSYAD